MCHTCWREAGKPDHSSAEIERAAELVGRLYQFASTGGPLHVAVDDWNLDDESVVFCAAQAAEWTYEQEIEYRPAPDSPGYMSGEEFPEAKAVATELAALLLAMPELDRQAALAHAEGFTGRAPNH